MSRAARRGRILTIVIASISVLVTLGYFVFLVPGLGPLMILGGATHLALVITLGAFAALGRPWARWALSATLVATAVLAGLVVSAPDPMFGTGADAVALASLALTIGCGALAPILLTAPSITAYMQDRARGYALFVAKRYMTSRSVRAVSMITVMAISGVALGVTIVVTVLAVTSGFQKEFREKVLGVNAHALVLKYGVDFEEYRDVMEMADSMPGVEATAPFLFNTMMMESGAGMTEVLVKGIDPELSPKVLDITEHLVAGSIDSLERREERDGDAPLQGVILGKILAGRLRVGLGGQVRILSPLSSLEPGLWSAAASAPSSRTFEVTGIFDSGFMEYDARLAYVELAAAQSFYDHGDVVMGVELRVADVWEADEVAYRLEERLGSYPYRTMDWRELNHNLFQALALQKLVLLIVFSLVMVVAGINIISTLHMMVITKRREISILKAMGATNGGVLRVFLTEGLFIGVIGATLGGLLGLGTCYLLERFPFPLDARVYLIGSLPVEVSGIDVLVTVAIVVLFAVVAALFPAYRAAQLRPVEGLRYE